MRNRNPGQDFNKNRRPAPTSYQGKSRGKPEKKPVPSTAEPMERPSGGAQWLYGLHAVKAALANPRRKLGRALLTPRAIEILGSRLLAPVRVQTADPQAIDRILPPGAVHQGAALEAWPLKSRDLDDILADPRTEQRRVVLVLDQLSDPQNVGAILRTAAAFNVTAVIVQDRHAPPQSGALAKAASGALERVPWARVVNLARALEEIGEAGFWRIGLAGEAKMDLKEALGPPRVALVLGAEGPGLRQNTREHCDALARLPIGSEVESLNVSNAAAVALYAASIG